MVSAHFINYAIEDKSYASYIKKEIHILLKSAFSESRAGEIDIVVSELISNLIKHAHGGELLYKLSIENNEPLFELLAIDNGPGIADVAHSMKDGVSSTNTLGHGLGSISRLSNLSQIYSIVGWGTIAYCRFLNEIGKTEKHGKYVSRCLSVALKGETVCGDGSSIKIKANEMEFMLGDGLGHGPNAKQAIDAAIEYFTAHKIDNPAESIREMNTHVKKTRGLVAVVGTHDSKNQSWQLCGIGNISARIYTGIQFKSYSSYDGIVGLNIPHRTENSVFPSEKHQTLIMCSDGIRSRWELNKFTSVLRYDPMILAACIYKEFNRKTDDTTILIVKLT